MTKIQLFDDDGEGINFAGGAMQSTTGLITPAVSLNAVTANGNGTVVDLGSAKRCISVVITTTGTPTAGTVTLSVSVDGTTFVASTTTLTVGANPAQNTLANVAFRYVRCDLTGLTGGTSPTVTAKVLAS